MTPPVRASVREVVEVSFVVIVGAQFRFVHHHPDPTPHRL
jgi:hypothetical protein